MKTFDQRVGRTPWSARGPMDPLRQALTNSSRRGRRPRTRGSAPLCVSSIPDQVFSTVRTRHAKVRAPQASSKERRMAAAAQALADLQKSLSDLAAAVQTEEQLGSAGLVSVALVNGSANFALTPLVRRAKLDEALRAAPASQGMDIDPSGFFSSGVLRPSPVKELVSKFGEAVVSIETPSGQRIRVCHQQGRICDHQRARHSG